MNQRTSDDAKSGIPAIPDPAALDQDQYGKMAQSAGIGAGSGAALGEGTWVHRPCSACVGSESAAQTAEPP